MIGGGRSQSGRGKGEEVVQAEKVGQDEARGGGQSGRVAKQGEGRRVRGFHRGDKE